MSKIIVDIVSPYGGREGGIENIIYAWTKYLDNNIFDLRIMHMTPGIAYLKGYPKAYYLNSDNIDVTPSYCASGYNLMLDQYGDPDICIATNTPVMSAVCDQVRKYRNTKMKVFSWVHNEIWRYAQCGQGGINEMLMADAHLVLNSSMEQELKDANAKAIVYNIGNPILNDIPTTSDCPCHNKLVFVGRLSEEKRLDLVLEAMYKAKSTWMLDIIGNGPIEEDVRKWINLLGLQKQTNMLGWKDNPLSYMTNAEFMISTSDYEGFMLTGAEALAMGIPVISTPTQGVKEYLKDSVNGYFINFNDANQLARLLDDIAFMRKQIPSKIICQKSVEHFSKENYFRSVEEILKKELR